MKLRREAWLDGSSGSSSIDRYSASWKLLWKTPVPGKIRMFLWRLAKHSIPTEDVGAQRKMSTTSACALSWAADSWRHVLLECTMARCVWALVDGELAKHLCKTMEPSAKQWLFSMMGHAITWGVCQAISDVVGNMVGKENSDTWGGLSESCSYVLMNS